MSQPSGNASSTSRAYPTIGIILLGGISDKQSRIPRHTSAGFAYTGLKEDIYVETRLFSSEREEGTVNGEAIDLTSSRSPFKLINRYLPSIRRRFGLPDAETKLAFESRNVGVLSGSSDGAAAAIGKCVESLSGEKIEWHEFENELRMISESVGRSIYGGLTITEEAERPFSERLLDPVDFSDYVIVGCKFSTQRKPSDRIHENVVNSPGYPERVRKTHEKGTLLNKLAQDKDIKGIFELAMKDTDEYHALIESAGVNIITDDMRSLIRRVGELKKDNWMTYIVTGGSNVFIPVEKQNYETVIDEAQKFNADPVPLVVAKGAEIIR